MLDDPVVEALEPGREERERLLGGELLDDAPASAAVPAASARRPGARGAAVRGVERRRDDVDAQHHPGAAAVRLVVDLAGAERRRVAVVEEAQLELAAEHARERLLLGEPGEGVGNEGEDVELQGITGSAKPGATTIRPPSRSTDRTQASTSGRDMPESSSSTSFAG